MKHYRTVLASALAVAVLAVPAHGLSLGGVLKNPLAPSSSSSDVGSQVVNFTESAATSNLLMANSSTYMLRALVSKERGAELQKQLDTINQISDPKEKNAELSRLVASNNSELATLEKDKKTREELKKASAEKKGALTAGLFNLGLGLLKVNHLQKSGTDIVNGVASKPTEALKVLPVKDTLPILGALAGNGKSLLDIGMRLARSADIKAEIPTSSDVKPLELDPSAFE